jgi:hypothetical protein
MTIMTSETRDCASGRQRRRPAAAGLRRTREDSDQRIEVRVHRSEQPSDRLVPVPNFMLMLMLVLVLSRELTEVLLA